MTAKYCVYVHCRRTDKTIFYVGKGSIKRANARSFSCRNKYWGNVVRKHGFFSVILYSGLTNDEACDIEKMLISEIGRDKLCNLTDGGDGTPGRIVSDAVKELMSSKFKGISPSCATIKASIKANSKPVGTTCGLIFDSATEAAKWLRLKGFENANKSAIFTALEGRSNKAYGYEFRYLDDNGNLTDSGYIDKTRSRDKQVTNGVDIFPSVSIAAKFIKESGLSNAKSATTITGNIVSSCKKRGKTVKAYGFMWGYVE